MDVIYLKSGNLRPRMRIAPLHTWLQSDTLPILISGPCGAESLEQLQLTAKGLKDLNRVSLFRAGIWKPRTRPDSFEGRGEIALQWLSEIKKEFGFKTTVEVANAQHAEAALKHGVDVLWIGARTTVNPFTVQEIADALKGTDTPMLIKNPIHADLNLWIGAIERFLKNDLNKIAAIHRGFHLYGNHKYRNEPLWQIPLELKTHFPEISIICDPSHISGTRTYIQEISQKALDLGMNGLMIESHIDPEKALSDAGQQLTPSQLGKLLGELKFRQQSTPTSDSADELLRLRHLIDEIDQELISVIQKRNKVIEQIGHFKKDQHVTIFQLDRWQEILRTRGAYAKKLGLSPNHIEKICQLLHEESIRIQNEIMNK